MSGAGDLSGFMNRLDECHEWPCVYTFKFIAPPDAVDAVCALFPGVEPARRTSSGGKYHSLTFSVEMPGSAEVAAVYEKAAAIKGVMAL